VERKVVEEVVWERRKRGGRKGYGGELKSSQSVKF